ncbi:MAG TPA: PQQ-binding-like beta-propeller repeat protein, partial [Candidatus Didemnitutus sp.]|nr:PQQ-binding-like beta-propeller repeat protein [Candidatus Didemnitutus sp.]
GVAYVGTAGGVFHAVRIADGSLAWTFSAGRPIFGEALATADAIYFVCDNGYLFKLARDTGKELWRYDLGDAQVSRILPHPDVYDFDYQAPRPTIADDVVYVGSGDGSFHAVGAADGKRVWRVQSKGKIRTDAMVQGANVIFTTNDGLVCAVERATGHEVWQVDRKAPVTSSPVIVGDRIILGGRDSQLQALDPATGKQLWSVGFWGSWVESTATAAGDKFYLGSSDLRRVACYNPKDGRMVWRTDVFGWAWARPLVVGNKVYLGTSGARPYPVRHLAALCALDRTRGDLVWRWPLPEPAGEFHWGFAASPAGDNDTLVIGALNGTLYGFPLQP